MAYGDYFEYGYIYIEGERLGIEDIQEYGYGNAHILTLSDSTEWVVAENREEAGRAVREYWRYMAENNRSEFISIIGTERLLSWALGEYDDFGISSFDDYLDTVEENPEEELASYDGAEVDIDERATKCANYLYVTTAAENEMGYQPSVAYRRN